MRHLTLDGDRKIRQTLIVSTIVSVGMFLLNKDRLLENPHPKWGHNFEVIHLLLGPCLLQPPSTPLFGVLKDLRTISDTTLPN